MKDGKHIVLALLQRGFNVWTESYRIMKGCTCGSQAAASGAVRFEGAQLVLLPQVGMDTHCSPTLPLGLLGLVTGPTVLRATSPALAPHFYSWAAQHEQPKDREAGLHLASSSCERLALEQPRVRGAIPSQSQSMCRFDAPTPNLGKQLTHTSNVTRITSCVLKVR